MANEVMSLSEQLGNTLTNVSDALPSDFNKTRFVQNALSVLNEHPELAKVNRNHVIAGLMKGAYLGLDFANKECYLIPYGNSVQFQTDYKGESKFVKKYAIRPVKDIYAKVVRQGDEFTEKIIDGKPSIDFSPLPFNGNDIIGAFAVVLYVDGGMEYETMSVADIQNVRTNYSKAANSKAWKNSFDEMAKKTVLRRLCKHIEVDFENVERRQAWEDGGLADINNKPVEAESNTDDPFVVDADAEVIAEAEEVFA